MKRVFIKTIGCRTNQADSNRIATIITERGYVLVEREEEADFIIINSCAVTSKAERDMRNSIYRAKRLSPSAKIILTGCFAQVYTESVPEGVSLVLGIKEREEIQDYLDKEGTFVSSVPSSSMIPREWIQRGTRAFLKIQDGCDSFCSYCIVPFARGKPRSVPLKSAIEAIQRLSSMGFKEIVLTGIRLGSYGKDLPEKTSLLFLLQQIENLGFAGRIRLSSIEPDDINREFVLALKDLKTLSHHLHIPLQSPSDRILKLMKRRYTFADFKDLVEKIKEVSTDFCIGTDLIIGFPGEEEEDFGEMYRLLESLPVDYFHVFSYSPRRGTEACGWKSILKKEEVKRRVRILKEMGEEKRRKFIEGRIGQKERVLIEEVKNGGSKGLTGNYIRVEIKKSLERNQFYEVQITEVKDGYAEGRLEHPAP